MVGAVIGTLPLGLGIALNPIAIVAGILILRTTNARVNGIAYSIGWLLGLALLAILPAWLVQVGIGPRGGVASNLPPVIFLAVGVFLLVAAASAWRGRPLPGEEPKPQRWKRFLEEGSVLRALGLGGFLGTISLRNLALIAAAASVVGQAGLGLIEAALTAAAFLAVSSLGILIPLLVRVFGGAGADATLARWGDWMSHNMGTITAVVMAVLGIYLVGRGIAGMF